MRRFFLGLATDFSRKERLSHTFSHATRKDILKLEEFLSEKYGGTAVATKNGRSALALALKGLLPIDSKVLVNGFTCYAVVEAVKGAGMEPVFVDISREDLNFTIQGIKENLKEGVAGIIVQNTLGNMVDIAEIEKLAKKHNLVIIEDLAHSAGRKYPDGREAGMVGAATVLSFGKDKVASAISGGAVIIRNADEIPSNFGSRRSLPSPCGSRTPSRAAALRNPSALMGLSSRIRIRIYPLLGAIARGLSYVHLGGIFMKISVRLHLVEKSADNRLDLTQSIAPIAAKTALKRLKKVKDRPIREFYLVNDREKVLKKLKKNGYYFDGFWYAKPIAPERYYETVNFPEEKCPEAVFVAKHIINLPNYYTKSELKRAREIINEENGD